MFSYGVRSIVGLPLYKEIIITIQDQNINTETFKLGVFYTPANDFNTFLKVYQQIIDLCNRSSLGSYPDNDFDTVVSCKQKTLFGKKHSTIKLRDILSAIEQGYDEFIIECVKFDENYKVKISIKYNNLKQNLLPQQDSLLTKKQGLQQQGLNLDPKDEETLKEIDKRLEVVEKYEEILQNLIRERINPTIREKKIIEKAGSGGGAGGGAGAGAGSGAVYGSGGGAGAGFNNGGFQANEDLARQANIDLARKRVRDINEQHSKANFALNETTIALNETAKKVDVEKAKLDRTKSTVKELEEEGKNLRKQLEDARTNDINRLANLKDKEYELEQSNEQKKEQGAELERINEQKKKETQDLLKAAADARKAAEEALRLFLSVSEKAAKPNTGAVRRQFKSPQKEQGTMVRKVTCKGFCKNRKRCTRNAIEGSDYCQDHQNQDPQNNDEDTEED